MNINTERETLVASPGMIKTDGTTYGLIIHLADGMDSSKFYEISYAEYARIQAEKEAKERKSFDLRGEL